jgi:hypothetical protein
MNRVGPSSFVVLALIAGCSSDEPQSSTKADSGSDVSVIGDTAGLKNDGEPPKDVSADPPPGSLAEAVGRELPPGATDLPLDLSCMGTPMPIKTGDPVERTLKTAELGNADSLIPETNVEIFYSNTLAGTADVSATSAKTTADFIAKIPPGFFLVRTKKTGLIETVAYDWYVDKETTLTFAIGNPDNLTALQVLIGGAEYMHPAGSGRVVAKLKDCKQHDIANAHVVLEVDGKIVAPVTTGDGLRRNYFGDNELPSKATVTSRSGVVAFLGVPASAPIRLIAYGKTGGAVVPIGIRSLKAVPDGVVTVFITPWNEP